MLGLLLLAQSVAVPADVQHRGQPAPRPGAPLTLVVADAVEQTDPRPLCGEPRCTSMFLGRFENGRVLSGVELPESFNARLEMGSPFISRYRLVLIVEQRPGEESVVHAVAGFNTRTGVACFDRDDTDRVGWIPSGTGVTVNRGTLCVSE